jgi:acetoin utilization deacetylase AcuC-like enzyme
MPFIAYDPIYAHPLPEGHRFPMLKYELIPAQLLHEGSIEQKHIFSPKPCPEEVILWTHDKDYWEDLRHLRLTPQHIRRIGFPLTAELVQREIMIAQGTIDNCHLAMQQGVAMNVAGGTHHAFTNRGEGFCLLNDVGIAANYLLHKNLVKQILVVDLDVHQGNGTAQIFQNEPAVFTFSMHGSHNFPFKKEHSDLDIPLDDQTGDELYLNLLKENLYRLLKDVEPDFIFFISGVDVLSSDRYGKLNISMEGCKQRDEIVFTACKEKKLPVAVSMGGGYSADIKIIVDAHCNTFRVAKDVWEL